LIVLILLKIDFVSQNNFAEFRSH